MIHSRRHFIAFTGTAALGAMLAACGSKKTEEATASPTASASIAGAYDNLSGELKWTKYVPGHGAAPMSSTDPETGQVYTIEPARQAWILRRAPYPSPLRMRACTTRTPVACAPLSRILRRR